jgi:uncharacterized protein YbcI
MPGFEFRYREGGGEPTIHSFVFKNTETLTRGDMLNFEDDRVDIGARDDTALIGAAVETLDGDAGVTEIRCVTDGDAVYAVEDAHVRAKGDHLDLTGATGTQGVHSSPTSDLVVVLDSGDDEETLVSIAVERHHTVAPREVTQRPVGGDLNAAIARAVVRTYREHTGRGPERAQAFHRNNIVVVLLEDGMTKAERSLLAGGSKAAVEQIRSAFQESMRPQLVDAVEELTGTRVRALMSTNSLDPDIAVEVFVLEEPVAGPSAPDDP